MKRLYLAALLATGSGLAIGAPSAAAQTGQTDYDIAAQGLADAIREYSRVSGRDVIAASSLVEDRRSSGVKGRLSPEAALARMLAGTGLMAELVDGALVLRAQENSALGDAKPAGNPDAAIIVTGTRIRGTGPVGSPVTVIDRAELDRSGRATLADFIQTIPQNFSGGPTEANIGMSARGNAISNIGLGTGINLRGLGPGATLTLFDGARPALGGASGAFTDLSLVPSAIIERVEILTDGASAIYGSDAIAGVVNIRFRNRFEGAETRLRVGTADGDYGEILAGQIVGTKWAGGSLVVAGEYQRRGALPSTQRAFATEDLRPFGGPDLRSNYNVPGTIVAANGQRFLIPPGQDGTGLTRADLIATSDFNRGDARRNIDILPRQRSASGYASVEQRLAGDTMLFARALYADRRFAARRRLNGTVPIMVTSANPYYVDPIGTGQPVTVYYDPSADFGPEGVRGRVKAFNASAGARGRFGSWEIELAGGYGVQREHYDGVNLIHFLRLPRAGTASTISTALNPFGDGAVNDPGLIDRLRGSLAVDTRFTVWTGALRADGTLFELPAGEVKLAFGAEYRRDRLTYVQTSDLAFDTPRTDGIPGLPDKRIVTAIYCELSLPVFDAGAHFPGKLQLSAAGRYEDYSDVGDTANPKLGARWTPLPGLALRASWGRSFRAPFFDELVGTANARYQTLRVADPQSPTGQSVVLALFGFRPDLGPERATSWTAGIDFEPEFLPGLKASATWFDIAYRGRIASGSAEFRNFLVRRDLYAPLVTENPEFGVVSAYFANPSFSNPIGAAPGDVRALLDVRTRNLSSSHVRGLDFDLGYTRDLGEGRVTLALGGSRLFEIDNRLVAAAAANNVVGTLGNPVKLRLRGYAGFALGSFDGGIGVHHVGAYRNRTVTPEERVKSFTTVDMQLGARIGDPGGRALRLALSINNIFDSDPPYARFQAIGSAVGYDPEQASPVGRTLALQAVITW
ncbi:MAG TPA: TonB-dependent receptor [Sphingopyxis sp.]|nr:TonB-dependent receptor [Sphingopyxis sp.]HWV59615.1 TonB-dependent receptor [Sphingopyxis sp.]